MNRYAVYVVDANGWDVGCPDSEGVFFGTSKEHGGEFYRDAHLLPKDAQPDGTVGCQGFVVVQGYRQAVALRKQLSTTGDWIAPPEINENGEETRPTYGIRKLA